MTDFREAADRARKAQEAVNELGAGPPGTRLTDGDRRLIACAREMPPDVTMDALRRVTGYDAGASDELVKSAAIGIAGVLLAELADRLERLGGPAPETIVRAWCKGCGRGTASVPCELCGGPSCANCGRCPDCDGDLPAGEE